MPEGRTQICSKIDARTRLEHAQKFLDVARLIAEPEHDPDYSSVTAALAVLAGIAAADAACCWALGRRARGQDHNQAVDLVSQIEPGGTGAGQSLQRLLNLKDQAHYGLFDVAGKDLRAALRQAEALVAFATDVSRH
jgi:hypothetical protein